ncbi:hypothetical protein QJS66_15260 [Kocuria rhizophila]|nr:hypothetical protein QJS66_15260 [Kocuria rhizophila]
MIAVLALGIGVGDDRGRRHLAEGTPTVLPLKGRQDKPSAF